MDDTVRPGVTLESLATLKPAFEWGDRRTTAGNASGVGDGAALCILTTRKHAEDLGLPVLGKYVASTFVGERLQLNFPARNFTHKLPGVEPRYMGISPVAAVPRVLAQAGLTKEDVDVFEVSSAG